MEYRATTCAPECPHGPTAMERRRWSNRKEAVEDGVFSKPEVEGHWELLRCQYHPSDSGTGGRSNYPPNVYRRSVLRGHHTERKQRLRQTQQ